MVMIEEGELVRAPEFRIVKIGAVITNANFSSAMLGERVDQLRSTPERLA